MIFAEGQIIVEQNVRKIAALKATDNQAKSSSFRFIMSLRNLMSAFFLPVLQIE
jgi:hypothetical protein